MKDASALQFYSVVLASRQAFFCYIWNNSECWNLHQPRHQVSMAKMAEISPVMVLQVHVDSLRLDITHVCIPLGFTCPQFLHSS